MNDKIIINREWAMPNKNTFDINPIHNLITNVMSERGGGMD